MNGRIKMLLGSAAIASALTLSACGSDSAGAGKEKLVISTWGFSEDFFNEDVYAPFEEEHNVDIVVETGNNAERLNKIRQGNSDVDLVYLSDYYAQQGVDDGLFEELDSSKLTNLDKIYDAAKTPNGEGYGPAYTIGQFGIAYNPEMVKGSVTSWKDLWNAEWESNVAIPGITTTTGPMFLDAASKVSGNDSFSEDAAFKQLDALKPNIVNEYNQTSEFVNMFGQGEIAGGPIMEMYFSSLKEAVPEAEFVTPEEGGYAVMNTVNVVKDSDQKELAEEFINYQLSTEVQEKTAKAKVDSPVNTEVVLSDEEQEGVTYGEDVIEKLNVLPADFLVENSKQWIDRWNKEVTK